MTEPSEPGAAAANDDAAALGPYAPIACGDYDFLEIACLDGYEVVLETPGGTLQGRALTTEVRQQAEYLVLVDSDGQQLQVRLDQLRSLRVITRPSRFSEHSFAGP